MNEETKKRIADINSGIIPEGYKKTKVGIVPVEWERYKLSDISEELTEKAGNNVYETLSISAGIGFVNQANKFGKELSGKQYEKYIVLHNGDFSYNKGNSKKYPQGCIYQLKDREAAAVPNVFESFRLTKGINGYYEQLFVSGFMNSQLFAKINHGVRDDGLLNLKGDDFYSCYVPFPPLPEQQKIAEILSTQDKLIELRQNLIEQKKQQKKWLMQNLLTGKIRLKGFDVEWKKIRFSTLFEAHSRFTDDLEQYPLYSLTIEDGVTAKPEQYERSHLVKKENNYKIVMPNEFVYNPMNIRFGAVARNKMSFPVAVSGYYDIFSTNHDTDNVFFDNYLVSHDMINYYEKVSTGSLIEKKRVHFSQFIEFCLVLPDVNERKAIAEILSQQDKEIELLEKELELQKQKKKALMQLLLTGKVRCK